MFTATELFLVLWVVIVARRSFQGSLWSFWTIDRSDILLDWLVLKKSCQKWVYYFLSLYQPSLIPSSQKRETLTFQANWLLTHFFSLHHIGWSADLELNLALAHRLVAFTISTFSLMTPPVVKQRMQMYNSPYHRVTDCVRAVWQNEGAGAFYRSYTTQLAMNVPFQAIHFMTYEFLQEHFNPQRRYNPSSHVLSGACAGAVAAAATTPLDVCKTLLNTQESLALNSNFTGHITGMASAFRTVYQVGGVTAYFRGVQARVIYQIPSTAIAWSVYEFFKYLITKRQEEWRAGKWSSTEWSQGLRRHCCACRLQPHSLSPGSLQPWVESEGR